MINTLVLIGCSLFSQEIVNAGSQMAWQANPFGQKLCLEIPTVKSQAYLEPVTITNLCKCVLEWLPPIWRAQLLQMTMTTATRGMALKHLFYHYNLMSLVAGHSRIIVLISLSKEENPVFKLSGWGDHISRLVRQLASHKVHELCSIQL